MTGRATVVALSFLWSIPGLLGSQVPGAFNGKWELVADTTLGYESHPVYQDKGFRHGASGDCGLGAGAILNEYDGVVEIRLHHVKNPRLGAFRTYSTDAKVRMTSANRQVPAWDEPEDYRMSRGDRRDNGLVISIGRLLSWPRPECTMTLRLDRDGTLLVDTHNLTWPLPDGLKATFRYRKSAS